MESQTERINLQYERAELTQILLYAKAHDVECNGRYDILRLPPLLNIWTHAWINADCKAESCVMFSLEVDWKTATLMFVVLMPGFDWGAFMDELATLERAALGESIYGRTRRESTI